MKYKFFVPFETAKALKEKGYNEPSNHFYEEFKGENSKLLTVIQEYTNEDLDGMPYPAARGAYGAFSAPTYHEVVDWLEGKDIYISVIVNFNFHTLAFEYYCLITSHICDLPTEDYPTREEALNTAILKALYYI